MGKLLSANSGSASWSSNAPVINGSSPWIFTTTSTGASLIASKNAVASGGASGVRHDHWNTLSLTDPLDLFVIRGEPDLRELLAF